MVRMISANAVRAKSERGEAWISMAGLPTAASRETSQSSAFFRPPGTPWAYSGQETMMPSALVTASIRSAASPVSARLHRRD